MFKLKRLKKEETLTHSILLYYFSKHRENLRANGVHKQHDLEKGRDGGGEGGCHEIASVEEGKTALGQSGMPIELIDVRWVANYAGDAA